MTCFEVLDNMLLTTDQVVKSKIGQILSDSCESYNAALFCKSRKTAIMMLKLFNQHTIEKIKELCGYNLDLMTHVLCVNSANYKKYSQSLGCFWYTNKAGLNIWSIPEPGEIMKTKIKLTTPSGLELKIGAKVNLLKFIHKGDRNNVLEAIVETIAGEKFKCSCRHIRRIQRQ
jgi:hypothetical protein